MRGYERLQEISRTAIQSPYVVVKLPLTHPRRKQTSCRQRYRIVGDPPLLVPMGPWPTDAEELGVQRSGAPSKTYQLLCECSYKVRCEVVRHGERLGELTFFDEEEVSVTQRASPVLPWVPQPTQPPICTTPRLDQDAILMW